MNTYQCLVIGIGVLLIIFLTIGIGIGTYMAGKPEKTQIFAAIMIAFGAMLAIFLLAIVVFYAR